MGERNEQDPSISDEPSTLGGVCAWARQTIHFIRRYPREEPVATVRILEDRAYELALRFNAPPDVLRAIRRPTPFDPGKVIGYWMIQSVNGFPEALERLEHLHAWAKGKTLDEQRATSNTPPIPLLLSPCPHVRAYLEALTRRVQPAISAIERAAAVTPDSNRTETSNGDGTTRVRVSVPLTSHAAFDAFGAALACNERNRHVIEHNERLMADNYPPPGWDAVRWRALAVAVGVAEADASTREGQEQIVVAALASVHRQRLTAAPTPPVTATSPPPSLPVPKNGEGERPDTGVPAVQQNGQAGGGLVPPPPPSPLKPVFTYDSERRVLSVDGVKIGEWPPKATAAREVLDAFQNAGWPDACRVDGPANRSTTIRSLNDGLTSACGFQFAPGNQFKTYLWHRK